MDFTKLTGEDITNIVNTLDVAFNILTEKRDFDEGEVSDTIEALRPFQNMPKAPQARNYFNLLIDLYGVRMKKEYVPPSPIKDIS